MAELSVRFARFAGGSVIFDEVVGVFVIVPTARSSNND